MKSQSALGTCKSSTVVVKFAFISFRLHFKSLQETLSKLLTHCVLKKTQPPTLDRNKTDKNENKCSIQATR